MDKRARTKRLDVVFIFGDINLTLEEFGVHHTAAYTNPLFAKRRKYDVVADDGIGNSRLFF